MVTAGYQKDSSEVIDLSTGKTFHMAPLGIPSETVTGSPPGGAPVDRSGGQVQLAPSIHGGAQGPLQGVLEDARGVPRATLRPLWEALGTAFWA